MHEALESRKSLLGGVFSLWSRVKKVEHRSFYWLAILIVVASCLRLYHLDSQSAWNDEAYTLQLASQSPAEIIAESARDNHPPLFYLLLHGWMKVATTTAFYGRLLCSCLGVLFVAVFYLFCREVSPDPVPTLAGLFMAVSPFAVWHSQDARMYTLIVVLVYSALTFFLGYLRTGSLLRLALFSVCLVASFYTYLYCVFILPVLIILLWSSRRDSPKGRLRRACLATSVCTLSLLPWVVVALTSGKHEAGFYKGVTLFSLPYALYVFSVGYSLGPPLAELHGLVRNAELPLRHFIPILAATLAFGTAMMAGIRAAGQRCGRFGSFVLFLFSLPWLLPMVVTLISRIDFNVRYAILSFPAFVLLLAVGVMSLNNAVIRLSLGVVLVILTGASLVNYYMNDKYAKEDVRAAYELVASSQEKGDCILVNGVNIAFRYYESPDATSQWLDFRYPSRLNETEATLATWSGECRGLWFVSGREWEYDPHGLALPTLEKYFDLVKSTRLPGVRVMRMKPKSGRESWHRSLFRAAQEDSSKVS